MKYERCNDCPHCKHIQWLEPGDFIYQHDRYCSLVEEDRDNVKLSKYANYIPPKHMKLLHIWCTTGDITVPPDWCPLKDN